MKNRILEQICSVALKRSFKLDAKQKRSLQNMRECKTTRYGGRVVQCTKCGTIATVYNSCNQRGCPICYKANQKRWEDKVKRKVSSGASGTDSLLLSDLPSETVKEGEAGKI